MAEYQKQADLLREWTIEDVKAQPALALGQMNSAAATIDRLGAEVDRLNQENFWLTKPVPPPAPEPARGPSGGRLIELPPVELGDTVWSFRRVGHTRKVQLVSGTVDRIEIAGDTFVVSACCSILGVYGKTVFHTKEEAEAEKTRIIEREKESKT